MTFGRQKILDKNLDVKGESFFISNLDVDSTAGRLEIQ